MQTRILCLVLTLLALLLPGLASAQVNYSKEDRATVRVMAVQGVVPKRVNPPSGGAHKEPITIGVAEAGHGSGVMLTYDGLIATAQHVVDDAEFVAVMVPGHSGALMAAVVYENKKHDVAFLKIPGRYDAFIPIPTSLPSLEVRHRVFALGYPLDGTRKYPQSNAGVLAGEMPSGELQLGMSVNPGNSGGPLIDEEGTLLGIIVRTADVKQGWQGIGVAVPISEVKKFYDRRVLGSRRLALARANEATLENSAAAAEVVSRVASISSVGTAIEHIEESGVELKKTFVLAARSHQDSPDFLALLAAHYWNESALRYSLDGRAWKQPLEKSASIAKRAVRLDQSVLDRSPFLYSAIGQRDAKKFSTETSARSAPRMIAGFRLGWSLQEASDACTIENLKFEKTAKGYRCSAPPVTGTFSGPVELQLCDERVCRVDVLDRPSRALSTLWVNQFRATYKQLKSKYGPHGSQRVRVPKKCKDNLLSCLEDGSARLIYQWAWKGSHMRLTLSRYQGKPTMRIIVRSQDPPRKTKKKAN